MATSRTCDSGCERGDVTERDGTAWEGVGECDGADRVSVSVGRRKWKEDVR